MLSVFKVSYLIEFKLSIVTIIVILRTVLYLL